MDRKSRPTIISIGKTQSALDFEEAEREGPMFTHPAYQRDLLKARAVAALTDTGIVAGIYVLFIVTTVSEMPNADNLHRAVFGLYGIGFVILLSIYFLLFMLSASQTPGMKKQDLMVVNAKGDPLDPREAALRGLGYLISMAPALLGFLWAFIDPEHLTWADKVSGTYLKRL